MGDPTIDNKTSLVFQPLFLADEELRPLLVPVIKATFVLSPGDPPALAETQDSLCLGGERWPGAEAASYRYEPEGAFFEPATELFWAQLQGLALARPKPLERLAQLEGQVSTFDPAGLGRAPGRGACHRWHFPGTMRVWRDSPEADRLRLSIKGAGETFVRACQQQLNGSCDVVGASRCRICGNQSRKRCSSRGAKCLGAYRLRLDVDVQTKPSQSRIVEVVHLWGNLATGNANVGHLWIDGNSSFKTGSVVSAYKVNLGINLDLRQIEALNAARDSRGDLILNVSIGGVASSAE